MEGPVWAFHFTLWEITVHLKFNDKAVDTMSTIMMMFLIAAIGYALGSIKMKGLQLGTFGVLIVALIFGHFNQEIPSVIRDIGLVSFVTAVGFIAGPQFFGNFRKKAMSFILLGIAVILAGAGICMLIIKVGNIPVPLAIGMMSGALTSTPGLAAAIESTGSDMASVGYGIAYPFGVVGVVLFVQLIPKLLKLDVAVEREKIQAASKRKEEDGGGKKGIRLDEFGMLSFAVAVLLGLLIAKVDIPLPGGGHFSLGTSGGPLLAGLIMGNLSHIGPVSMEVSKTTLENLREIGLALFLMGAGTNAGKGFVEVLMQYGAALFILGGVMTIFPMALGYMLSRKIFSIDVLNTLGSICGGMTSTPALGTLITMTRSEAVAVSYAATYPVALIMVVLSCEFLPILCG